jgi:hypothetical protein
VAATLIVLSMLLRCGVAMADIKQEIDAWEALINKYLAHRDRATARAPSLHYADARIALYGLTGNALVTGLLSLKMVKTTLLSNQWWDVNVPYVKESPKRQHQTDEFVVHSKIAIFVLFFSFFESIIRALLRAVVPGACNNAFDAFASVYTCLLAHLDLKQHISLLDFARTPIAARSAHARQRAMAVTLRNLIHNNGVYISKGRKNESLSFSTAASP